MNLLFGVSTVGAHEIHRFLAVIAEIFGFAETDGKAFSDFTVNTDGNFEVGFEPQAQRRETAGFVKIAEEGKEALHAASRVSVIEEKLTQIEQKIGTLWSQGAGTAEEFVDLGEVHHGPNLPLLRLIRNRKLVKKPQSEAWRAEISSPDWKIERESPYFAWKSPHQSLALVTGKRDCTLISSFTSKTMF
jgi:hypothetical protein